MRFLVYMYYTHSGYCTIIFEFLRYIWFSCETAADVVICLCVCVYLLCLIHLRDPCIFWLLVQQFGIHYLIICGIQPLTPNDFGKT